MIWNPTYEKMPRKELEKLQLERLKHTAALVYNKVPHYKKVFDKANVRPEDIKSLDDLRRLPFTLKSDMRDNYPYGLFSAELDNIVRIHASSGTTGHPTVVGYTQNDIDIWSEVMARTFTAAGLTNKDVIQNAFGYGLFTGGLGAHYGAERIGASVIPVSGGNSHRQIMLLKDFRATAICGTPSYVASLIETAQDDGVDLHSLPVRVGIFGAEPWSAEMRREIEGKWGIKAIDIYGLSEIIGPGVSSECEEEQNGLHINEDHFIVETINPETAEVLPVGSEGELVFTTISKDGMPLIRYRTRDLSSVDPTPCSCGRTFVRMKKVRGRSDDMLIIRGVNVFPSQIESMLLEYNGVLPYYQIVVDKNGPMDTIEVQVEISEDVFFSDRIRSLQTAEYSLEKSIKESIGISAKVRFVEHRTIMRSEGKAQRVIDKRTEKKQ
ncbi:MAG: phenylacetate--CoA ligase [Deferribacteraceae bacterium]|jgi:phenylacetate-CoA ligase|nr:phenylacetate--CoA ligase [Deferribacteraceae bacterium]